MVKIVGIAGSLRADSYSQMAVQIAAQKVRDLGAEVEILDLREMNLPFCNGGDEYPNHSDVQRLQNAFQSADGLILVSPEYHGGVD